MTKQELVSMARELGLKGYSKMNKDELQAFVQSNTAHVEYVTEPIVDDTIEILDIHYEAPNTTAEQELSAEQQEVMFDLARYAGFKVYPHLQSLAPTQGQLKLVKALQRNFKCSISLVGCGTRQAVSEKITAVYEAIQSGKVKPRSANEVKELLAHIDNTVIPMNKPATPAQLRKITELEHNTGIINTTIISNTTIADEVIKKYIAIEKAQSAQEVAITTIDNEPVKNSLFNAIGRFIKRVLA